MQEKLKIVGKLVKILPIEKGTSKAGKEWEKINFVIDNGNQYNPEVCFQLFGSDKVEPFNKFRKVGDTVEVSFNVSSRNHNGKYYHNLDAYFVGEVGAAENNPKEEELEDDLPF